MSRNLEKFNRASNSDWSEWCKVVKKVYKAQGHNLTQQQTLIIAREHYPGKGNVYGNTQKKLEAQVVVKNEIPANPVRKKREPVPKEKPPVYKREKEEKRRKRHDSESEEGTPPRRRKTKKKEESPLKRRPKKKYYYSSSSESEEEYEYVKRRKRRD